LGRTANFKNGKQWKSFLWKSGAPTIILRKPRRNWYVRVIGSLLPLLWKSEKALNEQGLYYVLWSLSLHTSNNNSLLLCRSLLLDTGLSRHSLIDRIEQWDNCASGWLDFLESDTDNTSSSSSSSCLMSSSPWYWRLSLRFHNCNNQLNSIEQ
jgi:hypothetical protein